MGWKIQWQQAHQGREWYMLSADQRFMRRWSPVCRLASNIAAGWHLRLPLLNIAMPVLVVLFRPELLVPAIILDISPLATLGEDPFNIIYAIYI